MGKIADGPLDGAATGVLDAWWTINNLYPRISAKLGMSLIDDKHEGPCIGTVCDFNQCMDDLFSSDFNNIYRVFIKFSG